MTLRCQPLSGARAMLEARVSDQGAALRLRFSAAHAGSPPSGAAFDLALADDQATRAWAW